MNTLPFNITRYLYSQWTERTFFGYILVDKLKLPVDWSENISSLYGIQLYKDKCADEQLLFLQGLFPYTDEHVLVLDAVNISTDKSVDIHLVPSKDELCILLFDVTESSKLRQELQQKNNEIKLLYDQEVRSMRTLRQSYLELQRQKEEVEKANQAKSKFLQQITHDLKSPLNGILGFAQLMELCDETLSIEMQDYVQNIKISANHLLDLIHELLDIASIESGKIKINSEFLTVASLIKESCDVLKPIAEIKKISFINRLDIKLPQIWADSTRFRQIIINLLSNAIKYNKENGCIIISGYITNVYSIHINIRDTGIGIKLEDTYKIFDAFERASAKNTLIEGTGIGLNFSKQLAELMQGTIGVYSDIGLGSLFWLEIPLTKNQLSEINISIKKQTVLYIGDNQVHIDLMGYLLEERFSYTLLKANNSQMTLKFINDYPITVILLDTDIFSENYLNIFQALQTNTISKNIPVIALFGIDADLNNIKSALMAGFYDYMSKPFDFNLAMELFDRIAAVY